MTIFPEQKKCYLGIFFSVLMNYSLMFIKTYEREKMKTTGHDENKSVDGWTIIK